MRFALFQFLFSFSHLFSETLSSIQAIAFRADTMTTTWISEIAAGLLPLLAFGRSLFTAPFGWSAATVRAFLLGAISGCLFGLLAVSAMLYFLHQPPPPQIKKGYRRAPQPSRGPAHSSPQNSEALRESLISARQERDRAIQEKTRLQDQHRDLAILDKREHFRAIDAQAQEYQREISQLRRNQQRLQTESNAKSQQISQLQAQLHDAQQTAASAQAQLRQAQNLSDRTNAELERQQARSKLEQEFKEKLAAAEKRLERDYQEKLELSEQKMRVAFDRALAGANVTTQQPRPRTGYIPDFTSKIKTVATSTFAASLPPVKKSEPEKPPIAPDQERQEAMSLQIESSRHDHEKPSGGADEKLGDGDDSASQSAQSSHLSDAEEEADDETDDSAGDDDDSNGDDGGEGPGEGVSASPEVGLPSSPGKVQQPAPVPVPSVPVEPVPDETVSAAPAPGPVAHDSVPFSPVPSVPATPMPASSTSAAQSENTDLEMSEADPAARDPDGVQQASGFNDMQDVDAQPTHDIADTDKGEDFQPIDSQAAPPGLPDQDTPVVDAPASQPELHDDDDDDMEDPPEMPPFSPLKTEDQEMTNGSEADNLSPVSDSQLNFEPVQSRAPSFGGISINTSNIPQIPGFNNPAGRPATISQPSWEFGSSNTGPFAFQSGSAPSDAPAPFGQIPFNSNTVDASSAPATNEIDMSEDNNQPDKFQRYRPTLEDELWDAVKDPSVGNPTGANLSTTTQVRIGEGMFGPASQPNQNQTTPSNGSEGPQSSNMPVRFGGSTFGSDPQPNQDQDTAMNESEAPRTNVQPFDFGLINVPAFGQGVTGLPSQPPRTNPNILSDPQEQSTRAVRDGIVAKSQAEAEAKRKARIAVKNKGKGKQTKDEDESRRINMLSKEAEKRERNEEPLDKLFALDKIQAARNHDHQAEEAAAREIVNKAKEEDAKAEAERKRKYPEAERQKKARQENQESSESDADDDENVTIVTSSGNPAEEGDEKDWEAAMNYRNPLNEYYRKPAATATPSPFAKPPTAPTPPPGYQALRRAGNTGPDFSGGGGYRVVSGGSGTYDPHATATRMYNRFSNPQQAAGQQTQSNQTGIPGNDEGDDDDDEDLVQDYCRECGEMDNHHTRTCSVPKRR